MKGVKGTNEVKGKPAARHGVPAIANRRVRALDITIAILTVIATAIGLICLLAGHTHDGTIISAIAMSAAIGHWATWLPLRARTP